MRQLASIACALALLCGMALAQSITAEATAANAKAKHDRMVGHAQTLLLEKEELQGKLAAIQKKLDKLDSGVDADEDSGPCTGLSGTWTTTSPPIGSSISVPNGCYLTGSGSLVCH